MLEIKNLTVKVKNDTPILTDVSLSIDEGTCIGLTGASGSGKTTLIKSIMGMNSGDLEIAQGQILLDGDNLLIHGAKERRALCGKTIGFIPQNPMTAFFPHAKMERQIIETLRMHTGLDKKQAHALAENVLRQVNLTDTKRVLSAYPGELSGGMLQRIAMALILGTKPKYVLADEPTSALDEANRDLLLELLRKYQKTAAILFISHDTEAMKALSVKTFVWGGCRLPIKKWKMLPESVAAMTSSWAWSMGMTRLWAVQAATYRVVSDSELPSPELC